MASHLGLHCLTISHLWDARLKWVNLREWVFLQRRRGNRINIFAFFHSRDQLLKDKNQLKPHGSFSIMVSINPIEQEMTSTQNDLSLNSGIRKAACHCFVAERGGVLLIKLKTKNIHVYANIQHAPTVGRKNPELISLLWLHICKLGARQISRLDKL